MAETLHQKGAEAEEFASAALKEAASTSHWMMAVWCVEEGELRMVRRTTFQFPIRDFAVALAQLNQSCYEEALRGHVGRVELPDPLPPVNPIDLRGLKFPRLCLPPEGNSLVEDGEE